MLSQACTFWLNGTYTVFSPSTVFLAKNQEVALSLLNGSPPICQTLTISSQIATFTDLSPITLHLMSKIPFYWEVDPMWCRNELTCTIPFNGQKSLYFTFSTTVTFPTGEVLVLLYQYENGPFFTIIQN